MTERRGRRGRSKEREEQGGGGARRGRSKEGEEQGGGGARRGRSKEGEEQGGGTYKMNVDTCSTQPDTCTVDFTLLQMSGHGALTNTSKYKHTHTN